MYVCVCDKCVVHLTNLVVQGPPYVCWNLKCLAKVAHSDLTKFFRPFQI